jgi:hypothetical protein
MAETTAQSGRSKPSAMPTTPASRLDTRTFSAVIVAWE